MAQMFLEESSLCPLGEKDAFISKPRIKALLFQSEMKRIN